MNNYQRAKKEAYNRVATFNQNHVAAIATMDGYTDEQNDFDAAHAEFIAAAQEQIF
jgi:hypothetical protein